MVAFVGVFGFAGFWGFLFMKHLSGFEEEDELSYCLLV